MAIQRTLLERLRNPDPAGQRQLRASTSDIFDSILTNLRNVLNTNQGNCLTDERYGLPHMSTIRNSMPRSVSGFVSAIQATIEEHEPRLSNVRVRHAPGTDRAMALRFEISGLVQDEDNRTSVRFETYADEEGRMRVR
ncbi:MAG: type VI secretion system baseplate subunit TssE [Planctomycetes bacterium]|nr:type VI secretion system baseplate subunit TssE [Planctomycetota bacterium]